MVILYLPPPTWPHRDTAMPRTPPGTCHHSTQGVSPYAKATALGWVGGKRVASARDREFEVMADKKEGRGVAKPVVFAAASRTPIPPR